jgi:hypothetical protein
MVDVFALHPARFKGQTVADFFTGDAQIATRQLPFRAVGLDPSAAAAFVSNEVGKFVLQSTPDFVGIAVLEFRIELNSPVRPPRTARRRPHPWIPRDADFLRQFVQG